MVDVTISLTGANGDSITFDTMNYILEQGVSGFGRAPVKVRIDEAASDGGVFRFSKRGIREIDLPVMIVGTDRNDVETKSRRLARILDDSSGTGTIITVTYANGDSWFIEGHYVSGATSEGGENGLINFNRWVLVFQCPNPFWTRTIPVTYTVNNSGTGRGLYSPNTMVNMKVASSQILGTVSIDNTVSDVSVQPTYVLTGPFDSATITQNGVGFTYNAAVTAGNSVTVNTAAGTVVDQAGVNKYANLSTAPRFFQIPAGISQVSMTAVNSTTATMLQLNFQPRKEVVF